MGGGVRDVKEQVMEHLVQETWSPELPASLGISLGSFPLSCSQILASSVQIRFFCLDFLLTTLAYFSFSPSPLFLSQSFSPLFFPFASLPPIHISSFPSFPFSSLLYFFPAQQYFPRKTDLIYYQSFAALCPVSTHSSSSAVDEPLIAVPHSLIPISNTHMVLLMSRQVGSYPGCLSRSYPPQREEVKDRIISLYPAVPQSTQMARPML